MIFPTPNGERDFPRDYIAMPSPRNPEAFYIAPFSGLMTSWVYVSPSKSAPPMQTVRPEHDPITLVMRDLQFMDYNLMDRKDRKKMMSLLAEIGIYDSRGTVANRLSQIQYTLDSLEKMEDHEQFHIRFEALEKKINDIEMYQAEDDIIEEKARQKDGYIAQSEEEQERMIKKLIIPAKKRKGRPKKAKPKTTKKKEIKKWK